MTDPVDIALREEWQLQRENREHEALAEQDDDPIHERMAAMAEGWELERALERASQPANEYDLP